MNLLWYASVSAETPLHQGDIISDCPVVGWREGPIDLRDGGEVE